jgi:peroxiredoxin
MDATVWLMGCTLLLGQQPAQRPEWLVTPRLSRGQELLYRGTFDEEVSGRAVHLSRAYRTETRVFVLDTPAAGFDVAFLTVVRQKNAPGRSESDGPASVRLEVARVDLQGRLTPRPGSVLSVPLDGPPTVECDVFVETPHGRIAADRPWETGEPGRPARAWNVTGTEVVLGAQCLKLEGVQQSEDWDRPRADRTAWRRTDLVWLAPKAGVAYRVERTIERREPARRDPSQRSVARYELESTLQYPGQLFEDRKREILAARAFSDSVLPLLPNPGKYGPKPFEAVLAKISHHLENQPSTPYREAIVQVRRRVEAARRGEAPPAPPAEEPTPVVATATPGQRAPDFVTTNLLTHQSARLGKYLGRPILMVFYSPTSASAREVLLFAQEIAERHPGTVTVLGFAVSEDAERVRKQHDDLRLNYPILSGTGLRISYGVHETPKLIVLDADGVLRAGYVGWGTETPGGVAEELKRALQK